MEDRAKHAVHVLEVMLERSEQAIALLKAGNLDDGLAMLRGRDIAFHNFAAVEWQLRQDQVQVELLPNVSQIRDKIAVLDEVLAQCLATVKTDLEDDMRRVVAARQSISKYRTRPSDEPNFERTA